MIKHFNDIGFTVVAEKNKEYCVNFSIYDHETVGDDDEPAMYHRAGSPGSPDPVEKIEDADIYLHGEVKWDGCSNWHFDEQDRAMIHGCSKEDVTRLGLILGECWDMAKEILPNFDG